MKPRTAIAVLFGIVAVGVSSTGALLLIDSSSSVIPRTVLTHPAPIFAIPGNESDHYQVDIIASGLVATRGTRITLAPGSVTRTVPPAG